MKKYLQLTIVLGGFFIVVFLRNMIKGDEQSTVVAPQGLSQGTPTSAPASSQQTTTSGSGYKDGSYTGSLADAYYGNIQVQVRIAGGRISDVTFLQYPNDNGTSQMINSQAMPLLRSEAIQAQSAQVDIISGASDSSSAFQQSLASALSQAK